MPFEAYKIPADGVILVGRTNHNQMLDAISDSVLDKAEADHTHDGLGGATMSIGASGMAVTQGFIHSNTTDSRIDILEADGSVLKQVQAGGYIAGMQLSKGTGDNTVHVAPGEIEVDGKTCVLDTGLNVEVGVTPSFCWRMLTVTRPAAGKVELAASEFTNTYYTTVGGAVGANAQFWRIGPGWYVTDGTNFVSPKRRIIGLYPSMGSKVLNFKTRGGRWWLGEGGLVAVDTAAPPVAATSFGLRLPNMRSVIPMDGLFAATVAAKNASSASLVVNGATLMAQGITSSGLTANSCTQEVTVGADNAGAANVHVVTNGTPTRLVMLLRAVTIPFGMAR